MASGVVYGLAGKISRNKEKKQIFPSVKKKLKSSKVVEWFSLCPN
jgi:hypothetical protein